MIVDVLRNDLGRVCRPGSVRVPRLCRLERTAAVQHLVSTVTGQLAPGRDAFDLLAASFPGGSITGAPKIRAMELLEELEPVRRGPYTGALGWIGPDGAMATSIIIRTFVADGARLSLHVGGGITYQSDPAAEWDETVAKARGPLDGDRRHRGRGRVTASRPAHIWLDGRLLPADAPHLSAFDRGSSSGTACSRRFGRAAGRPTELPEHVDAAPTIGGRARDPARRTTSSRGSRPESRSSSPRRASTGRTATRASGSPSRAASSSVAGLLPPDEHPPATIVIQAWPVAADARRPPRARPPPRLEHRPARPGEPARGAQDDVARRLRLRASRGADGRRRRRAVPDDGRLPVRSDVGEPVLVRGDSSPRRRSAARSCPARPAAGSCAGRKASGSAPRRHS